MNGLGWLLEMGWWWLVIMVLCVVGFFYLLLASWLGDWRPSTFLKILGLWK
jgi:hypothetical protein